MLFRECLCFALGKVSRAMARVYRERLEPYGLTQPQFFLLIALYEEDDIPISRLGAKAALDKSSLTGILDRLERDGFVVRAASPDDRRAIHVRLTPKARALEGDLRRIYEETNRAFLSRLTDEERAVVDRVVAKLEGEDPGATCAGWDTERATTDAGGACEGESG
ncbi:MarR family winged helix-turn-helix transcriptional regulator [Deferrisoma sp.]